VILGLFLIFIAISCFVAVNNYRRGFYLLIAIGAIQDPIRKMIPGAPSYLVLATAPVLIAMALKVFHEIPSVWSTFSTVYPRLAFSVKLLMVSLLPGAVISATYGRGTWMVTLIGLFSYSCVVVGMLAGYRYIRDFAEFHRIIGFYCILTAIMLIGGPLQYLGLFKELPAIGTDYIWMRYTGNWYMIMIAGFYRSPDVMGWHASMLTMLSIMVALMRGIAKRYFWLAMAVWGAVNLMICGRRKMVYMLPIFIAVLGWVLLKRWKGGRLPTVLAVVLVLGLGGFMGYQFMGRSALFEGYYLNQDADMGYRINSSGYGALVATYEEHGFFGAGLGFAYTGIHNLDVPKPRIWQEGGLDRMLVELGVPGLVCVLFVSVLMMKTMFTLTLKQMDPKNPEFIAAAGLMAIFCANGCSFILSHQIYGDPFVLSMLSILVGVLFSFGRIQQYGYGRASTGNSSS
jgi:O-antigen ligase